MSDIDEGMKNEHRDLLVLFRDAPLSPEAMEKEVNKLHELLCTIENYHFIATACELIDLNKYKVITTHHLVKQHLRLKKELPFVFVNNRN